MAEFVHEAQRDFWRSPVQLQPSPDANLAAGAQAVADACPGCSTEYMIGAKFCHACGQARPSLIAVHRDGQGLRELWVRTPSWLRPWLDSPAAYLRKISIPRWLRYLHFHEIQRSVGLPTASLIAFFIGLGCVAGAICVSFFYRASNLAEFQAIQMWRMEWLMAATAAFVGGILLKAPSDRRGE
jgi:hypothetical protein